MTCRGCSTVFEFNSTDIEFEQVMQEDESFASSFFVNCPGCTKKIVLRNLPQKIQQEVASGDIEVPFTLSGAKSGR